MFPLAGVDKVDAELTTVAVPPNQAASVYFTLNLLVSELIPPFTAVNLVCVSNAVLTSVIAIEAEAVEFLETI